MATITFRTSTTTTSSSSCCCYPPPLLWNAVSRHPPVRLSFFPSCSRLPCCIVRVQSKNHSHRSDSSSSEQKWVTKGLITESLPNGMFWVRLENGDVVLGYTSGKMRCNKIRMMAGDIVKIEVSRYDSTRGRIVYRVGSKD